jgi:L,D-peptidoglycan transpeptidase YkuD (ErfK/YbiS/YcfS/YnhG family)
MDLIVEPDGFLVADGARHRCALGRGGIRAHKIEGDGATPVGRFPLRRVHYRPDRLDPPVTALSLRAIAPSDGWCDDPADEAYNRLVAVPYAASAERLWREDHLYDLVVELGYNDDPVVPGKGSAIFLHLIRPDWGPTDGCVAVEQTVLAALLGQVDASSALIVQRPQG